MPMVCPRVQLKGNSTNPASSGYYGREARKLTFTFFVSLASSSVFPWIQDHPKVKSSSVYVNCLCRSNISNQMVNLSNKSES